MFTTFFNIASLSRIFCSAAIAVATAFSTSAFADGSTVTTMTPPAIGYTFTPKLTSTPNDQESMTFYLLVGRYPPTFPVQIAHTANLRSKSGVVGSVKIVHLAGHKVRADQPSQVRLEIVLPSKTNVSSTDYDMDIIDCNTDDDRVTFYCETKPNHPLTKLFSPGALFDHTIEQIEPGLFLFSVTHYDTKLKYPILRARLANVFGLGIQSFRNTFTHINLHGNNSCVTPSAFEYGIYPPFSKKGSQIYNYKIERDTSVKGGLCSTNIYPTFVYQQ